LCVLHKGKNGGDMAGSIEEAAPLVERRSCLTLAETGKQDAPPPEPVAGAT
jgi:hypothetical protein